MRRDEYLKMKNGFRCSVLSVSADVNAYLQWYASQLLGKVTLTSESLSFFFSLISPYELRTVESEICKIVPNQEEKENRRNYYDIYRLIERIEDLPMSFPPARRREIENSIIAVIKTYGGFDTSDRSRKPKLPKRVRMLSDMFGLSKTETELVLFFFIVSQNDLFADIYEQFEGIKSFHFISSACRLTLKQVRDALDGEGKLVKMQIIESTFSRGRTGPYRGFELSDIVVSFLGGLDSSSFRRDLVVKDEEQTFPLGDFSVPKTSLDIVTELLRGEGPCNIIFYGNPGTGKTELARALTKNAGKTCYFLRDKQVSENYRRPVGNSNRTLLLQMAANVIEENSAVLIVDEADTLLNTENQLFFLFGGGPDGGGEKGTLNTVMDSHKKKMIWITNSIRGIKDSVLRRFSYSLQFKRNSVSQRIRYWTDLVERYELSSRINDEKIKRLSVHYKINAGHIGKVLETYSRLSSDQKDAGTLEEILDRQSELIHHGRKETDHSYLPHLLFDPRFLNTDIPIARVMTGINSKIDAGSFRGCNCVTEGTGSHLLLYGVPGTGKTEFARYIARNLGKELLLKRSSDILGPWVGVNEQNIRDAFSEAEADGAVLCIDEADSFFKNRRSARSSWEVSFTNELLTQMESFRGVFICSTNLVDILDPAVMRRFAWKIKFLPLKKEHRLELVLHYFELSDASREEKNAFTDITDLTPGDIKAVWLKYGSKPMTSSRELAEELERETSFRKSSSRTIGFTSSG